MIANIFTDLPQDAGEEEFRTLLEHPHIRIERIVSTGQHTLEGKWYDQDRDEWVLLVSGSAGLVFEGDAEPATLVPGDYVHIPAHRQHRVAWTDAGRPTIWLAIHLAR